MRLLCALCLLVLGTMIVVSTATAQSNGLPGRILFVKDGDLWVEGRVDDMIVSGGENIHPLEVEDVLARHEHVREVAVIGAPDDRWGQRVVACVVPAGDVTAEELDAFCLASPSLARFKRPREYRFVDALPKSPSGKILRRLLREETVTA